MNPKTVDRRRGAAGAKTDQIDAYLLAKLGRSEQADLRRRQARVELSFAQRQLLGNIRNFYTEAQTARSEWNL